MKFKPVIFIVLCLVAVLLGLFACGSSEETPPPAEEAVEAPAVVKDEIAPETPKEITAQTLVNLNLRQGPGTDYPVTGSLPANTEVIVVGRLADGSWLQVKTDQGEGWIS